MMAQCKVLIGKGNKKKHFFPYRVLYWCVNACQCVCTITFLNILNFSHVPSTFFLKKSNIATLNLL